MNKPISDVHDGHVSSLVTTLNTRTPAQAYRLFKTLKTMFGWAMRGEYRRLIGLQHNPIAFLKADALGLVAYERDRVFEYEEAHAYLLASTAVPYPYGPCLRVLIETGQRIGAVSAMRWSQVNLERKLWIIPGTRNKRAHPNRTSKTKFAHKVPLSDHVRRALALRTDFDDTYLFHGRGQTAASLVCVQRAFKKRMRSLSFGSTCLTDLRNAGRMLLRSRHLSEPIPSVCRVLGHYNRLRPQEMLYLSTYERLEMDDKR